MASKDQPNFSNKSSVKDFQVQMEMCSHQRQRKHQRQIERTLEIVFMMKRIHKLEQQRKHESAHQRKHELTLQQRYVRSSKIDDV